MRPRTSRRATAAAVLGLALCAGPAAAHDELVHSSPHPRAALAAGAPPRAVSLHFGEPTAASDVRIRVVGPDGRRVDVGSPRPSADGAVGVRLRAGSPDGSYVVGWRASAADGHVSTGTFGFKVGDAAGAPAIDARALDHIPSTTALASDVARTLQYTALALAFGTMLFGIWAWRPAEAPDALRRRFARRSRRLLLGALALGALSAAGAMACQAATVGESTLWSSELPRMVFDDVTGGGAGCAWAVVTAGWLAALASWSARPGELPAVLLVSGLALSPALCGHAAGSPLAPAVAVHVAGMAAWIGGLATLLVVWRTAADELEAGERVVLLAHTVARFSRLALPAACAVLATGVMQAVARLGAPHALFDSAYGRLVLVKLVLFAVLMALAARARLRLQPRLWAGGTGASLDAARALRATIASEVALAAVVLAATGVLAGSAPPA